MNFRHCDCSIVYAGLSFYRLEFTGKGCLTRSKCCVNSVIVSFPFLLQTFQDQVTQIEPTEIINLNYMNKDMNAAVY